MSRLSIEISSEEHQHIKALAALEGKSIKTFVLERVLDNNKVSVDNKNLEWEELKSFLRYRIVQAENEEASTKNLDQIAEEILQRYNAG